MPPSATSRTKTATTTTTNSGSSSRAVAGGRGNKRKSMAADPTLLEGSDSDNDTSNRVAKASHKSSRNAAVPAGKSGKGNKIVTEQTEHDAPSTRRSTRLSGEGLPGAGEGGREGSSSPPMRAAAMMKPPLTKAASKTSAGGVGARPPAKRKAQDPQSQAVTGQPTPPDTESGAEEEERDGRANARQQDQSRKKQTSSTVTKKPRVVTEDALNGAKKPSKPVATTPNSDSDDDAFVFTQMSPPHSSSTTTVPSATIPSTSVTAPPRNDSKTSKTKPKPSSSTSSARPQSANEANASQSSRTRTEAVVEASTQQNSSSDRKGKRKAAETDVSGGEASIAPSKSTASKNVKGGKQKKGRTVDTDAAGIAEQQTPPVTKESREIAVYSQETPAIARNIAMRNGERPLGTPGSVRARRVSGEMRGRRGSNIGNGMEALPHPEIGTKDLWRHLKVDVPPAVKLGTIVSWSALRIKEGIKNASTGTGAGGSGQKTSIPVPPSAASDDIRRDAAMVLEGLLKDLADKRVNLTWPVGPNPAVPTRTNLPPHPDNVSNQQKTETLKAWTARLYAEDEALNVRVKQYRTMFGTFSRLLEPVPTAPPAADGQPATLPDIVKPNFSLSIPKLKSKEDMLALGEQLILPVPPKAPGSARRKSRGKAAEEVEEEAPEDPDVLDIAKETGMSLKDIRHQSASMQQTAHRIDQFLKLSNTFLSQHLARSHLALAQVSQSSLASASSGSSSATKTSGLQIGQMPSLTSAAHGKKAMTRALLRGISKADTSSAKRA